MQKLRDRFLGVVRETYQSIKERIEQPKDFYDFINAVKSKGLKKVELSYGTTKKSIDETLENSAVNYRSFVELRAYDEKTSRTIKLTVPIYELVGTNHKSESSEELFVHRAAMIDSVKIARTVEKLGLETRINKGSVDQVETILKVTGNYEENRFNDLFWREHQDYLSLAREYL